MLPLFCVFNWLMRTHMTGVQLLHDPLTMQRQAVTCASTACFSCMGRGSCASICSFSNSAGLNTNYWIRRSLLADSSQQAFAASPHMDCANSAALSSAPRVALGPRAIMSKGLLSHCLSWGPAFKPADSRIYASNRFSCNVHLHTVNDLEDRGVSVTSSSPEAESVLNCGSGAVATRVALE